MSLGYLTDLPSRRLLEAKLHEAIWLAREQIAVRDDAEYVSGLLRSMSLDAKRLGLTHKTIYMPATPYHDKSRHGLRQSVRTMIAADHDLFKRQAMALCCVLEHGGMTIRNCEQLCLEINRRRLRRDPEGMVDGRDWWSWDGVPTGLIYRLAEGVR